MLIEVEKKESFYDYLKKIQELALKIIIIWKFTLDQGPP